MKLAGYCVMVGVAAIAPAYTIGCNGYKQTQQPILIPSITEVGADADGMLRVSITLKNASNVPLAVKVASGADDLPFYCLEVLDNGEWVVQDMGEYVYPAVSYYEIAVGAECKVQVLLRPPSRVWRLRLCYVKHIDTAVDPLGAYRADRWTVCTPKQRVIVGGNSPLVTEYPVSGVTHEKE